MRPRTNIDFKKHPAWMGFIILLLVLGMLIPVSAQADGNLAAQALQSIAQSMSVSQSQDPQEEQPVQPLQQNSWGAPPPQMGHEPARGHQSASKPRSTEEKSVPSEILELEKMNQPKASEHVFVSPPKIRKLQPSGHIFVAPPKREETGSASFKLLKSVKTEEPKPESKEEAQANELEGRTAVRFAYESTEDQKKGQDIRAQLLKKAAVADMPNIPLVPTFERVTSYIYKKGGAIEKLSVATKPAPQNRKPQSRGVKGKSDLGSFTTTVARKSRGFVDYLARENKKAKAVRQSITNKVRAKAARNHKPFLGAYNVPDLDITPTERRLRGTLQSAFR